ncbi:MAG: hypothetical protein WBA34_12110 [Candidatus Deferrimicrobiaceae bacterium]
MGRKVKPMRRRDMHIVTLRFHPKVVERIDKRARAMRLNRSQYLEAVVEFSLDSGAGYVAEVLGRWIRDMSAGAEDRTAFGDLESLPEATA